MKFSLTSIFKFVIFLAVGILILYCLFKNNEAAYLEECALKGIATEDCSLLHKITEDFRSVNVVWLGVILIIYMLSNLFRALRWRQMLESVGYRPRTINTLGALMIGYFSNMALPRVGELIKTGALSKYENIPFETTIGTVVLDRILDILCLLIVIGLSLILSFDTFKDYFAENFVSPSTSTIVILGILGIMGLVTSIALLRLINRPDLKNPLLLKIQKLWKGFYKGITSLLKVKNPLLLIAYSIGIWTCYYLMTYLCFFAFHPVAHLSAVAGLVVFVFGTLGMIFPSPGGMGSYHLLITQSLVIYGISSADAFSFSNIIFFTINIFGNITFGILFLIILPLYNKKEAT